LLIAALYSPTIGVAANRIIPFISGHRVLPPRTAARSWRGTHLVHTTEVDYHMTKVIHYKQYKTCHCHPPCHQQRSRIAQDFGSPDNHAASHRVRLFLPSFLCRTTSDGSRRDDSPLLVPAISPAGRPGSLVFGRGIRCLSSGDSRTRCEIGSVHIWNPPRQCHARFRLLRPCALWIPIGRLLSNPPPDWR
jgi:hypothetical protein